MSDKKNKRVSCFDAIKANLLFPANYEKATTKGNLKLTRNIIPLQSRSKLSCHIDIDTAYQFSGQAMRLGITPDELLRQLIWSCTADMQQDVEI